MNRGDLFTLSMHVSAPRAPHRNNARASPAREALLHAPRVALQRVLPRQLRQVQDRREAAMVWLDAFGMEPIA